MFRPKFFILMMLVMSLGAACAPITPTPSPIVTEVPTQASAAVVRSIEILLLESFPLQVHAVLRGDLPDAGCTTIASVNQVREGNTFQLTLVTTTDPLAVCAQALTPFEEVVPLDVHGLPAGIYTVEAGEIQETFEFTVDNILPTDPHENQPTPPGTAQSTNVQYVMAQQDVPIYGGPSDQYSIVGNIAAGQTAKVTGVTSDNTWWRVMCPNDTVGDCWVSADPSWTQPAEAPQ
jgi:uncharacterized protein YgiM (DUF1202 family)